MQTLIRPAAIKVQNGLMDSTHWERYSPRAGDIVVATYPKCGTTWTQRIVDLLIFQSPAVRNIAMSSPWFDCTFQMPLDLMVQVLEAQTHRRSVKSHLPFTALPVYEGVKFIHVARDGRDSCMSMHNHQLGFTAEIKARMATIGDPTRAAVPEEPRAYFLQWIGEEEKPSQDLSASTGSYFDFEMTYWNERKAANVLLVHFNDLKADLAGEMRRISNFLEIDTPQDRLQELAAAASFESMKRDGDALLPSLKMAFDRGADRFINKGTNGRWRDVLTAADVERYLTLAREKFTPACAAWIEKGRLAAGDPEAAPD